MKRFLILLNIVSLLFCLKWAAFLQLWEIPRDFQLITFNVGQGDAFLVVIPKTTIQVLIDTGPSMEIIEKLSEVMPIGDSLIDIVLITHSHCDHGGGIESVLDNYDVGMVIDSAAEVEVSDECYLNAKKKIKQLEVRVLYAIRGEKIKIGEDFVLEILHPFLSKGVEYVNQNNASVAAKISYNEKNILMMGDLEQEGEAVMLDYLKNRGKEGILKADVLKVGHHGSRTSTSDDFLDLVSPKEAIIACAKENKYGHPHKETVEKLKERGVEIKYSYEMGIN